MRLFDFIPDFGNNYNVAFECRLGCRKGRRQSPDMDLTKVKREGTCSSWPRQPVYKKQAQRHVFWLKI